MTGTADDDADLHGLLQRSRRVLTFIVSAESLLLGVALVAIGLLAWKVLADETRLASTCSFYSDLGQAPVTGQSSQLAVQIIVDSRKSFHGQHCPGTLPPPSQELLRLAAADHVAVRY